MGTECQKDYSDEDQQLLDEAEGRECGLPAGVIEREMPAIQAGLEARCVEVMQENSRNARADLVEGIGNEKPTNIELLDLSVEMTEKECHAIYQVAKELGLTEDFAIIDMPGVVAISNPEAVLTEARVQALYESGELKLENINKIISQIEGRVEQYHMDVDTTAALMRETLSFLGNSKIPENWRDQNAINNIVFVDRRDPGAIGEATPARDLINDNARSRNVYIYPDENGKLIPGTEAERKELQWTLAHEICHCNDVPNGKIDEKLSYPNGISAVKAQLKAGPVSEYARLAIEKCKGDFDKVLIDPEFRAELFAAWVMDSPKLCPKTKEFLDKEFSA